MKTKILLGLILCLSLVSCLEVVDETTINSNGSGELSTTVDMSEFLDLMKLDTNFVKKNSKRTDNTFSLKEFTDNSATLTAKQKKLLEAGTGHVRIDLDKKIYFFDIKVPFASLSELEQVNMALVQAGYAGIINKATASMDDKPAEGGNANSGIEKLMAVFDYKIDKNEIKRSVNEARLKKLKEDPELEEMKMMAEEMDLEIGYKTVYNLPRPVKSVNNDGAKLSNDRKTVTLKTNIMEIFTEAEQFELTIKY